MDSKELQGLLEAYTQVHTTQEVDEAVKGASPHTMEMRKGDAADRRKGIKPKSAKEGERYASYKMAQMAHSKREKMGEEVEQIDEVSADLALKASKAADVKRGKLAAAGDKEGAAGKAAQASRLYKAQADRRLGRVTPGKANEELDLFDAVLEYLVAEGYAATNKEALVIMANMSEEWRSEIVESQYARENPEKYEREQAKAKSKKQKAMEDPHTGINSPAFEKFMRQQMGR